MDAFPAVTEEDVATGMVAFCTPAPSAAKRMLSLGAGSEEPRPFWSQSRVEKSRIDATAPEKRLVCKVYQKLGEWIGRWGADPSDAPIARNEEWFGKNRNSPIREIAAQLLGLSSSTVGNYWKEMQGGRGVLTSAKPRGPAKKSASDLAIRGYKPEEGSLYDLIKGRMADVHASGQVNTSRNLLRWATEDADGPMLPRVGERFFREILARLGFDDTKRRKLIVAARRKPYVVRWRKAYCWRRS